MTDLMEKFDLQTKRYEIENKQKWREDIKTIPFIQFPADWKVQVIPPFGDAVVRFRVRLPSGKEKSIYLDTRESLGYYGGPYWEVYPYRGDVARCDMEDIESLLLNIADEKEDDE